ncbi:MAG: tripartite tricarboxylate transporter substrate binding protein, partial [Rhodospirillales bacterium]|nr:tripartite tricarboxylate transporter substrate binding protein [Rhodospirillales bacterium]
MLLRRTFLVTPLLNLGARAQPAWPVEKPIEVIIPVPPGGSLDVMPRLIMPYVAARISGMRVVMTNRTGASGQVGMEALYNAVPDGYTLGAATLPALSAIPLERSVRFQALSFTYLANVVEDANAFYVRADSPLRSLADLVATARARPGGLTYGTGGVGTDDHLFMLAFEREAGLPPSVHVPFSGVPPQIPQLLGGNLDLVAANVGDVLPLVLEGRLRILAQAAENRQREAPDVPTFREAGLDGVAGAARGILAPPGLPPAITQRLTTAFAEVLRDEGFLRE